MDKRLIELLVIFAVFKIIYVIPERCDVSFVNTSYIEHVRCYIKRYGRKSGYYMNMEGYNKQVWNNNVSIHLVFNEYLHNEYRRSFIEVHYKFCDLINWDPYVGGMLVKKGLNCPLPIAHHYFLNMTAQTDNFPNVFPFEKGRIDIDISMTESGENIAKAQICAIFKNKNKLH